VDRRPYEGFTGWATAATQHRKDDDRANDAMLFTTNGNVVLPMFYKDRDRYIDAMRHAIALNGSFFNTERMVDQYIRKAYFN
jgi:starch phosphorylase